MGNLISRVRKRVIEDGGEELPPKRPKTRENQMDDVEEDGRNNAVVWFLYTGQPRSAIPRDVTHARIDQSVKVIGAEAFRDCEQLVEVDLCEGLEQIGEGAFEDCTSLECFKTPSSVKVIGKEAFYRCRKLAEVELCEGLEEIGESAFQYCISLKRFKTSSTLRVIGKSAFDCCSELVEVELSEGLEEIEERAFYGCTSLKRFKTPSSLKVIGKEAFQGCGNLAVLDLCEGLQQIGEYAFLNCKSLKRFKVPSTVKKICRWEFANCGQLTEVKLCAGLEVIGANAFRGCKSLKRFKLPSTVKRIGESAFEFCEQLTGVELCERTEQIDKKAFNYCFSLRNMTLPPDTQALQFKSCHDLLRQFGSQDVIIEALKCRFDGLPIHRVCYIQSYYPTERTIHRLNNIMSKQDEVSAVTFGTQDCLGMTPLHILACSTNQDLELYRFIVTSDPNSLITEDKWGCTPLLYAIWFGAPQEIIQFLIDRQKSTFPDHILVWDNMLETLCRAGVSLDIVKRLLDTRQTFFSDQSINWQKAAQELTIRLLVERNYEDWEAMMEAFSTPPAYQELAQRLLELQQRFFPGRLLANLQPVCEELVQPLTGWWRPDNPIFVSMSTFQFLVKCSIQVRLNALGVKTWRMDVKNAVERISSVKNSKLEAHFDTIRSKLVTYEQEYPQLMDAAFLLELALWKSKIDENHNMGQNDVADVRGQCRFNCGADIIIPNVLPYLILNEEEGGLNESSSEEDSNDSSEEDSDEEEDSGDEYDTDENNGSDEEGDDDITID